MVVVEVVRSRLRQADPTQQQEGSESDADAAGLAGSVSFFDLVQNLTR